MSSYKEPHPHNKNIPTKSRILDEFDLDTKEQVFDEILFVAALVIIIITTVLLYQRSWIY